MSLKTLAVILGAGPGTGQAIGLAFAKQHTVALLARNRDSLQGVVDAVVSEGGDASPFACDASSAESLQTAFQAIRSKYPDHQLKVACFNANAPFIMKPFMELKVSDLATGINLDVMGAFHFSQLVIPYMLESQGGTLIFSGATAALKGGARFAAFAPSKFALRGLSQSLAREFGPSGIHVSHAIIDGFIDTPALAKMMGPPKAEGDRISPASIADAYVWLASQDKSCWTQELDLRPSVEKF